jgi:RNA polymerase sigma factor (TIGR02999 family)
MAGPGEVTRLLTELGRGGHAAADRLMPLLYNELRQIAHRRLRGERPDHTLNTTALVHEAYVKLIGLDRMTWQNRAHFLAIAAQAMRRVLVDYAVGRKTQKRGGLLQRVPLDETMLVTARPADTLIALDGAIRRLESISPRLSRIVECRYFGGMSIEETAQALQLSPATIKREWNVARAWLNRELKGQRA